MAVGSMACPSIAFFRKTALGGAALLGLLLGACNREFNSPYDGDGSGIDTSARGGDTVEIKPDSLRAGDMQLTEGGEPMAPQVEWFPANFPDKRYSLLSSNAAVAKVEGGKVRPMAPGEADITVITEKGRLMEIFTATVKAKPKPPDQTVRVISVTAKPVTLYVDQEASTQLTWNPANATDKTYSLSSQDPDIAGIKGTRVVGKAQGTATVVVTAKDGGKTASFTVTVKEEDKRIRVQGISMPDMIMVPGAEAEPIITWTPADVTDKGYKILTSDASVVSVQGRRFRAESPGTAMLVVQPDDDPSRSNSFRVRVSVPLAGVSAEDMAFTAGDPSRAARIAFRPANATDKRYRLSSADPRIAAIVQDTLVQPVAPGETRITITAVDGDHQAEFAVKVSAKVIPVEGIKILDLILKPGDPDTAPSITWSPPDATDQSYTLSAQPSQDPAASVAGDKVHAIKAGTTTFTATPSGGGQPVSFLVTVLSRLDSLSAADLLAADDDKNVQPLLTWHPADVPDKTYTMVSDNPGVAEVKGGHLATTGVGQAKVTVTATEGARQAVFTITVVKKKCKDILEGRDVPPDAEAQMKCCRETYDVCPAPPDPPVDTLPPGDPPVTDTLPPADTTAAPTTP